MEKISLLLRQRKLLYILQHRNEMVTGAELAKQLGTTSRTVRSDILIINRSLAPYQARIRSVRSKGYTLEAEKPGIISKLLQAETAFLTKEDRLRYLAFRLCASSSPIDCCDLEDEMFVSRTTLENDLKNLRKKYVLSGTKIGLVSENGGIAFEKDERKRRHILNELFFEYWNYNERSNAFYGFDFLDGELLNRVIDLVPSVLRPFGIRIEDANTVVLDLACAIMLQRISSGHPLPPAPEFPKTDELAMKATAALMDALEEQFHCALYPWERDEIYLIISSGRIMDTEELSCQTAEQYFSPTVLNMARDYLDQLRDTFGLDFRGDEDFYITLLQFIHYLQAPVHIFNTLDNAGRMKEDLLTELELAWLFQETACRYGCGYLGERELLHLANCLSGAIEQLFSRRPEVKIRAVICCHMHTSTAWAIKRKVLGRFSNYLDVTALLPVNTKSVFDFSGTDLILSTVDKRITDCPTADTIGIAPYVSPRDIRAIETYIHQKLIQKIYPVCRVDALRTLLEAAWWREDGESADLLQAIEAAAGVFPQEGAAGEAFVEDVLRREAIWGHEGCRGLLFLPSVEPANRTQLSLVLLRRQSLLRKHKVRVIALASFRSEDRALLFHLDHFFHRIGLPADGGDRLTREDVLRVLME